MEFKPDVCPQCGGTDLIKGKQTAHGSVVPYNSITFLKSRSLIHLICRRCGTVVRSYIEDPRDFN